MISLARITYSSTVEHSNDDQGDDSDFLKKVIALTIENKSRCHLLKYFVSHKESTVESLEQYALLMQIYDPSEEPCKRILAKRYLEARIETVRYLCLARYLEDIFLVAI